MPTARTLLTTNDLPLPILNQGIRQCLKIHPYITSTSNCPIPPEHHKNEHPFSKFGSQWLTFKREQNNHHENTCNSTEYGNFENTSSLLAEGNGAVAPRNSKTNATVRISFNVPTSMSVSQRHRTIFNTSAAALRYAHSYSGHIQKEADLNSLPSLSVATCILASRPSSLTGQTEANLTSRSD